MKVQRNDLNDFERFPDEIVMAILFFVPVQDIVHRCTMINKRINAIINNQLFWNNLCRAKIGSVKVTIEMNELYKKEGQDWKRVFMKLPNTMTWKKMGKKTWVPVVEAEKGSIRSSKFGGCPYIPKGEEYPKCVGCQKPVRFFLQLNSATLPTDKRPFGEGIFQFFHCDECDDFDYPNEGSLCRVVDLKKHPEGRTDINIGEIFKNVESHEQPFVEKVIKSWKEKVDYPSFEQFDEESWAAWELFKYIDEKEIQKMKNNEYKKEIGFYHRLFNSNDEAGYICSQGEKYLGYPDYVQSEVKIECPICNELCMFFFQVDSNCNLDYMWGDKGCGHLYICPEHKDQIGFGWDCG